MAKGTLCGESVRFIAKTAITRTVCPYPPLRVRTKHGPDWRKDATPMSFAILTDTSCNLPQSLVDEFGLDLVPLHFYVNEEEHASYADGKQADFGVYYAAMRSGVQIRTSCTTQSDVQDAAERLASSGMDVLCIAFSSGLSATYEASSNAIREVAAKHPERKIYCVDSLAASGGQGLLLTYVARMRDEGASIDECKAWVEQHRLNIMHWFTVDDLMFLKRGGRVSSIAAIFGTALRVKPVLHVDEEGRLKVVEKVRGRSKSIEALADHFGKSISSFPVEKQTVYISHGDCLEDAESLASLLKERYGVTDVLITFIDPVIGAHSGPGTVALFYYDVVENR